MRRELGLLLLVLLSAPGTSHALTPFDVTNPVPRSVVVYIDNNFTNPALVGTNLIFAFKGTWSTGGGLGTVTVPAANTIAAFATSGAPGTASMTGSWSNLVIDINLSDGRIMDWRQSGFIHLAGLGVTVPFLMHLNTLNSDFTKAGYPATNYTLGSFFTVSDLGDGPFPTWCSKTLASECLGQSAGPAPFNYVAATGRFNAIGPIRITVAPSVFLNAYGTYGDAQLFEEEAPTVPLGPAVAIVLMAVLGATGLAGARRRASD